MHKLLFSLLICFTGLSIFWGCGDPAATNGSLPIYGFRDIDSNGDTIYHKIPDFSFINQDSTTVTNATFEDKVYIADFFFIHCPSICPKVKAQMMRIYEKFDQVDELKFISHSIDTKNDSVPALKAYADKLQISSDRWHFVTGDHDMIYEMADNYYVSALVDPDAPGGFDHSGNIVLVDKNRHIRASALGTDPEAITRFIGQIQKFLDEKK